jgi:hypothetical protein
MGIYSDLFFIEKFLREAFANKGYSPLLNFQVEDIMKTIEIIKSYGGSLDGEVIKDEDMKVFDFYY